MNADPLSSDVPWARLETESEGILCVARGDAVPTPERGADRPASVLKTKLKRRQGAPWEPRQLPRLVLKQQAESPENQEASRGLGRVRGDRKGVFSWRNPQRSADHTLRTTNIESSKGSERKRMPPSSSHVLVGRGQGSRTGSAGGHPKGNAGEIAGMAQEKGTERNHAYRGLCICAQGRAAAPSRTPTPKATPKLLLWDTDSWLSPRVQRQLFRTGRHPPGDASQGPEPRGWLAGPLCQGESKSGRGAPSPGSRHPFPTPVS